MMLMVAMLLLNAQISLAWLRAPTKPSCIQSAPAEAPSASNTLPWRRVNRSAPSAVGRAAGVRRARFFLYFAEFLCSNTAMFFSHMRSLRHYNDRLIKKKKVMLCFPRRLVLGVICCLSGSLVAHNARGFLGDVAAEYRFPASAFVMSPTQPLMYAAIPSQNSVAIINANTLAVQDTVFVGSHPVNLAFSPNGSKAYIANSTSNFVVVLDTHTHTIVNSFLLPEHPQDVVFGSQNRLWVLGQNQIFQIDSTTGATTGPSIGGFNGGVFIYSGSLEISPDRNTLYYGDYGLSPSTITKLMSQGSIPCWCGRRRSAPAEKTAKI